MSDSQLDLRLRTNDDIQHDDEVVSVNHAVHTNHAEGVADDAVEHAHTLIHDVFEKFADRLVEKNDVLHTGDDAVVVLSEHRVYDAFLDD